MYVPATHVGNCPSNTFLSLHWRLLAPLIKNPLSQKKMRALPMLAKEALDCRCEGRDELTKQADALEAAEAAESEGEGRRGEEERERGGGVRGGGEEGKGGGGVRGEKKMRRGSG